MCVAKFQFSLTEMVAFLRVCLILSKCDSMEHSHDSTCTANGFANAIIGATMMNSIDQTGKPLISLGQPLDVFCLDMFCFFFFDSMWVIKSMRTLKLLTWNAMAIVCVRKIVSSHLSISPFSLI